MRALYCLATASPALPTARPPRAQPRRGALTIRATASGSDGVDPRFRKPSAELPGGVWWMSAPGPLGAGGRFARVAEHGEGFVILEGHRSDADMPEGQQVRSGWPAFPWKLARHTARGLARWPDERSLSRCEQLTRPPGSCPNSAFPTPKAPAPPTLPRSAFKRARVGPCLIPRSTPPPPPTPFLPPSRYPSRGTAPAVQSKAWNTPPASSLCVKSVCAKKRRKNERLLLNLCELIRVHSHLNSNRPTTMASTG